MRDDVWEHGVFTVQGAGVLGWIEELGEDLGDGVGCVGVGFVEGVEFEGV